MKFLLLRLPLLALVASLALPVQAQPQAGNGAVPAPSPQTGATNGKAAPADAAQAAPQDAAPQAATPAAPTLSDLGRSLRNYFTEEELTLLFQYMKESVIASFNDEEVNLPPDLSFKLEILLVRMKKESDHYMDNLINQLEKDLKHKIQEKLAPPPIKEVPYNPWYTPPQR